MQKQQFYLFILIVLFLLVLIGCGKGTNDETKSQTTNDNEQTENESHDNTKNNTNENTMTEEEIEEDESYYEVENRKLRLGDSARYKMYDQQFEIVPTGFEIIHKADSVGKVISSYEKGVYLVVDLTVKNTGNTDIRTIDFIDLANYYLINNNQEGRFSFIYPDRENEEQRVLAMDRFEKDDVIPPGEEQSGKILFETTMAEEYTLGLGDLSSDYQREAVWYLSLDEATSVADNVPKLEKDDERLSFKDEAEIKFIQGDGITDSFVVTPTSMEVKDEIEVDGEVFTANFPDEKVIVITLNIKNTGKQPIDEDVIRGTSTQPVLLLADSDYRQVSRSEKGIYEVSNDKLHDIQPDEEVERKIYFSAPESSYYELQMGSVYKVLYHNKESIWRLHVGKDS